jgi:pSer/pThr/pTyr-binding forkhead associated (FHA) protein
VNSKATSRACGRDASNDLVLDHPAVSRVHALLTLAPDGLVWLQDQASRNGTFLRRCGTWLRVEKALLCAGDEVRFGSCEIALERLTALFGDSERMRLGARQLPLQARQIPVKSRAALHDSGERLSKPRRNPVTGKIEDKPPA